MLYKNYKKASKESTHFDFDKGKMKKKAVFEIPHGTFQTKIVTVGLKID